jgi:hypothetical protein
MLLQYPINLMGAYELEIGDVATMMAAQRRRRRLPL